jgi:hypothetical protein
MYQFDHFDTTSSCLTGSLKTTQRNLIVLEIARFQDPRVIPVFGYRDQRSIFVRADFIQSTYYIKHGDEGRRNRQCA